MFRKSQFQKPVGARGKVCIPANSAREQPSCRMYTSSLFPGLTRRKLLCNLNAFRVLFSFATYKNCFCYHVVKTLKLAFTQAILIFVYNRATYIYILFRLLNLCLCSCQYGTVKTPKFRCYKTTQAITCLAAWSSTLFSSACQCAGKHKGHCTPRYLQMYLSLSTKNKC